MEDGILDRIRRYENTAEHNEALYAEFKQMTDTIPWLKNHRDMVERGGFLVLDDAGCFLPGRKYLGYFKGCESVSLACEEIPALGFTNVLNVCHIRIYQRTE